MIFKKWSTSRTAKKYFREGSELLHRGEPKRAIEQLSKAIELVPMLLDAYIYRALAHLELGDIKHVFPDLDFVILHDPDAAAAYYCRSKAYLETDQADLALADINKAAALDPRDDAILAFRCFVHLYRKEYAAAVDDATKVIQLGHEEAGYNNRAIVFANMGNYQAAIEDWTRVIAFNPDDASAYCSRGILLEKVGQFDRAISDLEIGLKNKNGLKEPLRLESEKLHNKLQKRKR